MSDFALGSPAPDFTLESSEGGTFALSAHLGKIVVLYFYPKDNTSGCTKEACAFRDFKGEFDAAGAEIFGVSPDSLKSHGNFSGKFNLNFPLLSDPERKAAELYGVLKMKKMYGKERLGLERSTFIIDPQGKFAAIYRKVKVDGHIERVLEEVKGMAR